MRKFLALLVLAIINMGYGVGKYIESCAIVTDEWGTSFVSNFDYFVWFISGVIILIIAICIYKDNKNNNKGN